MLLYAESQENAMKSFSRLARTLLAGSFATVFCAAAFAQNTPTISTLNQEATLAFTQIGFAGTPNIPDNVLASITGGALEVRQVVEQRSDGMLRIRHILVPRNAPNPTPAGTQNATLEDYLVRVDNVIRWPSVAATPPGSTGAIALIGTITEEFASSPFGSSRNLPFIYSAGFDQTSTGTRFINGTLTIPGRLTTFIPSGMGTLAFTGSGGGGTTPPPTGPVIGIADRITTLQTQVELDAMATDAGSGPLTYSWRVVQGTAIILDPTAARPRVQVPRVFGEHTLEVTVTNAAGQSTRKTFVIFYQGTGSF
jgi:hypothetical protein